MEQIGTPLKIREFELPKLLEKQVLVKNHVCGVCRTDLHVVDGELPDTKVPIIPGHQIVGHIVATGSAVDEVSVGDRVGLPWLGWSCRHCQFCLSGQENLCDKAKFTGFHVHGGFAEHTVADARYCLPIATDMSDLKVAPLLCAGLIGYRAYRMINDAMRIAFYGFGSAAHILLQLAKYEGKEVYAITKPGDKESQKFALDLGAEWANGTDARMPQKVDAAIIFAPAGELVPHALKNCRKGGVVVCAGIHMSDIPSFKYEILWGERVLRSVANLTRQDGVEFLRLIKEVPIQTHVKSYALEQINDALCDLRDSRVEGSVAIELKE